MDTETCKHAGRDALIVERNEGVRWVTCTECGAEFVRRGRHNAEVDRLRSALALAHDWAAGNGGDSGAEPQASIQRLCSAALDDPEFDPVEMARCDDPCCAR